MRKPTRALAALLAALALVAAACESDDGGDKAEGGGGDDAAATDFEGAKIGFIFVGACDDFGYNQAACEGADAVAEAFPDNEVLKQENVPETQEAERAMEDMIEDGAKIVFPTSYGHLTPAVEVAKRHPDVIFIHQGGTEPEPKTDNLGTYFGTVYERVYQAGIAAGAATESKKLGFVVAFPIPQTLANINAFALGAQSIDPDITTTVIFTSNWCDPAVQAEAAKSLLDQGVDVITQHQDCTKTIVEAAEEAGAFTTGYHADTSSLAPEGWLVGAVWDWGPLYTDIVKTILADDFVDGEYNGDVRVGLRTGDNPFVLSDFGPSVTDETKAKIAEAEELMTGGGSPFDGPVVDQDGRERIADGKSPTYEEIDTMDYLVKGVVGTIPS